MNEDNETHREYMCYLSVKVLTINVLLSRELPKRGCLLPESRRKNDYNCIIKPTLYNNNTVIVLPFNAKSCSNHEGRRLIEKHVHLDAHLKNPCLYLFQKFFDFSKL